MLGRCFLPLASRSQEHRGQGLILSWDSHTRLLLSAAATTQMEVMGNRRPLECLQVCKTQRVLDVSVTDTHIYDVLSQYQ